MLRTGHDNGKAEINERPGQGDAATPTGSAPRLLQAEKPARGTPGRSRWLQFLIERFDLAKLHVQEGAEPFDPGLEIAGILQRIERGRDGESGAFGHAAFAPEMLNQR